MNLISVLGHVLQQVAKRNKANPDVKTADPVVFDEMKKKLEKSVEENETKTTRKDMYKDFFDKVEEAKRENEESTEVETAHSSVFDDMLDEIEKLKKQVNEQSGTVIGGSAPTQTNTTPQTSNQNTGFVSRAMTNSQGGSLAIRLKPEMGAPQSSMRIPDKSLLTILEYSNNKINLDGKLSRFVLVDYNGEQGWILESYLNFN